MRTIWHFSPREVQVWDQVRMAYVIDQADPKPVLFDYRQPADLWPTLWCEVTPVDFSPTLVAYVIVGTGQPIPAHPKRREFGVHVASCVDPKGVWVWHLYRLDL